MFYLHKAIVYCCLFALSVTNPSVNVFAQFSSGTGTATDPFLIKTAEELDQVRNHLNKHFRMVNTIDLTAFLMNHYNSEGWLPIGDDANRFEGVINGGGFEIRGLWIRRPELNYVGLFGVNAGIIDSLGVVISAHNIEGSSFAGSLAGCNYGTINYSYVTGPAGAQVISNNCSGGLAGQNFGTILYCKTITVNTFSSYASGNLVGHLDTGEISYCYSTGTSTSLNFSGGMIGYMKNGLVSQCFAMGNSSGSSHSGGLIGFMNNGSISYSYAIGTSFGSRSGGLIGFINNGAITNCYATGAVSGTTVGGFAGGNRSCRILNCYYNSDKAGVNIGVATGNGNDKVIGLDNQTMTQSNTFLEWDFSNIWSIDEGSTFPYLSKIPYYLN